MGCSGFLGPRTVLEGTHGFFRAFAPSAKPDFSLLREGLGERWLMQDIAFRPYACGTMTQPYIDCAIALPKRGVEAAQINTIVGKVGEGTVHRAWDPLTIKHAPPTPYGAKFSTPFCMAVAFFDRCAGLAQFTQSRIHDPAVPGLARKIRYEIDPQNEYPVNFTGHLRATDCARADQNHMRGGSRAPLPDAEFERKFVDNALHGGWSKPAVERARVWCADMFNVGALAAVTSFRQ
jgi:2-methylcitrate dehydratase PrpD